MNHRFRKYFFSGLAVFLPIALTVYVSFLVLNFAESILGRYLRPFFLDYYDFYFWGLGIVVLVLIIAFIGFLVTNYFGRRLQGAAEKLMLRIPLVANIYPAFKEIANFIFRKKATKFERVVLVEWPRKGAYTIGFMTNTAPRQVTEKVGPGFVNVLVPTVPNPLTGFIMMVPETEVIPLPISVEDAVKMIVSGGVVHPSA